MHCAYVTAVKIAIDFALHKNRNLFTDQEADSLVSFSSLPYNGQRIYGRLLTRQSKWLKTSDFEKYVDKNLGTNTDPAIDTAVAALIASGYLFAINKHSDYETAWNAAVSSFSISDWQAVGATLMGSKVKASNRDELIQSIRRAIETQKTFFGTSQRGRFADIVCRHILVTYNCSLVRLTDEMAILIRRVQRLYQLPSGMATSFGGLDSAYRKLEICVPLMTTFKLLTFPRYQLPSDTSSTVAASFLFPDQRTFHCWEAAVELHAMMFEFEELENQVRREEQHVSIFDTVSPRMTPILQKCMLTFQNEKFMLQFVNETIETNLEAFVYNIMSDLEAEPKRFTTKKVGLVGTICFLSLFAEYDYEVSVEEKDYLIRYRAGTQFSNMLVATAATLEKTTEKLYLLAILLYEFLLCLPYVKHRRGKWYIRLCIDYEHLKLPEMALKAAERGLADRNILGSDEIGLMDRAAVLRERVKKSQEMKAKEAQKKSRKSRTSTSSLSSSSNEHPCDEYTDNVVGILTSEAWKTLPSARQMKLLSALILQEMERIYRPTVTDRSHRRVFQPSSNSSSSSCSQLDKTSSSFIGNEDASKWTCQVCTFVNTITRQRLCCEVCMSPRSTPASSTQCTAHQSSSSSMTRADNCQGIKVSKTMDKMGETRGIINLIDDDDDVAPQNQHHALKNAATLVDLIEISSSYSTKTVSNQPLASWKFREILVEFQAEITGKKNTSQEPDDVNIPMDCNDDDFLVTRGDDGVPQEVIDLSKSEERLAETVLKKCADILHSLPPPLPSSLPQSPHLSQQSNVTTSRNNSPSRRALRQQFSPSSAEFTTGMFTGKAFTVSGRRFHGDVNNKRKGKSIFCGVDDEMLSVEEFVMRKLFTVDTDEDHGEDEISHNRALTTLKAVPLLRNFRFLPYTKVVDNGGWQGYHCEGSIFRTLFGLIIWDIFFLPVPHALLTAHQDAPLDFPTVAFFTARQEQIIERIHQITHSKNDQLMMEIQRVYHSHKGEQCRLVSWDGWDLRALQLAALCIGAKALAHLCLAMCIDYRQFRSGAPDLFLMRVKIVNSRDGREQIIPLETLLGENWQSRGKTSDDDEEAIFGEDLRKPPANRGDKQQNSTDGWGQPRFTLRRQFSGGTTKKESKVKRGAETSPTGRSLLSPEAEKGSRPGNIDSPHHRRQSSQVSAPHTPSATEDQSLQPLQLPPHPGSKLVFECMWVEVKGPSDHLAYKQLLWLQLLAAANLPAYVAHVKEEQHGELATKKRKVVEANSEQENENIA